MRAGEVIGADYCCCRIRFAYRDHSLQAFGEYAVVCLHHLHVTGSRRNVKQSTVVIWNLPDESLVPDYADAFVLRRELGRNLRRPVRTLVVDEEILEVFIRL